MICVKCRTGADLTKAGVEVFEERATFVFGGATVSGGLTDDDGPAALATAAAIVRLHTECDGSDQGCPCQHRGTAAQRLPEGSRSPLARITSPAVSA